MFNIDHRRKGALKRDIESLRERNGALGIIVAALRTSCDSKVSDILHQLRADEDLEVIAKSVGQSVRSVAAPELMSLEGDLSNLLGKPGTATGGETRHFGLTSSLSLAPEGDDTPQRAHAPTESWTRVTQDSELVGHLMGLYFSWLHPFFTLFSSECFLHDMACGRIKYCSPLLVNALLALACNYSDRSVVRTNQNDTAPTGDAFFAEAKRLLNEDDRTTMTTVQALAIMGLREASCGRDSSSFQYSGRCARMALELGLHLSDHSRMQMFSRTELEVRKISFWGCFVLDNACSLSVGRVPQIPRAAITIEKPTIVEPLESKLWTPYIDKDRTVRDDLEQPGRSQSFVQHFCTLSEILNDIAYMFYAPRERFTSKRLLGFFGRPSAQLLSLHMYYHTALLHLFRPFSKVQLLDSNVRPRQICSQSAEAISSLMVIYRELYGLRRSTPTITHFVMTASTIHLLDLPNPSASASLAQGILDLRVISTSNPFACRCLRVIKTLSEDWAIELPEEVPEASSMARAETLPLSPASSRSTFTSTSSLKGKRRSAERRQSVTDMYVPLAEPKPVPMKWASQDLFWSPFPDQVMTLLPHDVNNPMNMTSMLTPGNCGFDEYSHDGFRMVKGDDPILGHHNLEDLWATV
ncbi:MAG: hypothetical protein M1835_000964 [Candelina submexicana]|nr:MAG: hypothetical protein M1835_000964 [Candelina submexicana]